MPEVFLSLSVRGVPVSICLRCSCLYLSEVFLSVSVKVPVFLSLRCTVFICQLLGFLWPEARAARDHSVTSCQLSHHSPDHIVTSCQLSHHSPDHSVTSCQLSHHSPDHSVTSCQLSHHSPDHIVTSCQLSHHSPDHIVTSCQLSHHSPDHSVTSCQLSHHSPDHSVTSCQLSHHSPDHSVTSCQLSHHSPDRWACCHTQTSAVQQAYCRTQSTQSDTCPTSPSTDPVTSGRW